jgi:hypothetical protein
LWRRYKKGRQPADFNHGFKFALQFLQTRVMDSDDRSSARRSWHHHFGGIGSFYDRLKAKNNTLSSGAGCPV